MRVTAGYDAHERLECGQRVLRAVGHNLNVGCLLVNVGNLRTTWRGKSEPCAQRSSHASRVLSAAITPVAWRLSLASPR